MKHYLLASILGATLLTAAGCSCEHPEAGNVAGAAVKFSTSIARTRAYNNLWEGGDLIGVYMMPSAADDADVRELAEEGAMVGNMKYGTDLETGQTDNNVVFAGADEQNTLVWPKDGSEVDFVAYYPWIAAGIEDFALPVDVRVQNPQRKIDLMWSDNAKGQSARGDAATLLFSHRLVKVVFNVTDLDGESIEGMTATVSGLPSTAKFDLAAGRIVTDSEAGDEDFKAVVASLFDADGDPEGLWEQAVVEAIVLPGEGLDYSVTFGFGEGGKAVLELADVDYEAGKRHIYNVELLQGDRSVRFVEGGEAESITQWEDVEEDDPRQIPKESDDDDGNGGGGTPTGEKGAHWSSGTLAQSSRDYTVSGSANLDYDIKGLRLVSGSSATISKSDYEGGVERITINAYEAGFASGKITSVTVGGVKLQTSGNEATEEDLTASGTADHVFVAPSGALLSGKIEIAVANTSGNVYVTDFAIN